LTRGNILKERTRTHTRTGFKGPALQGGERGRREHGWAMSKEVLIVFKRKQSGEPRRRLEGGNRGRAKRSVSEIAS